MKKRRVNSYIHMRVSSDRSTARCKDERVSEHAIVGDWSLVTCPHCLGTRQKFNAPTVVIGFRVHAVVQGKAACGARGELRESNTVAATRCARLACEKAFTWRDNARIAPRL